MAVASWMLRSRSLRNPKALKNRPDNKDDVVKLDFSLDPVGLMQEILQNICQKNGISSIKKLNYLNAFVHLISRNPNWKTSDVFGLSSDEILCCLRIALIQDSVQVRAIGLRALRYTIKTEDDVLNLNKFHFPYLISRSLDLLLKSDNERILMSERIQSLKMMRHILSIAPQHFSVILVRPLISVALRPIEETDRLLKACLALLCELCILNSDVFMKCDGVKALLRNAGTLPSSHMVEAICGALLYLLNKPSSRKSARIDLNYLISGYTNSTVVEKNSFREEERRLTWTNFVLLTMLKSCSGLFELCNYSQNMSGLKSIVQTLYLNNLNIRKAILELLFDLINIPQPDWTDDENVALESIHFSRFQESFKLSEGFLVSEGKQILPSLSKTRVNLTEAHLSLLLICLLDAGLPDALVEVIVSSDAFVSLRACILLGEFLYLIHRFVPVDCYVSPPSLPNLISYAIRGCPLQPYFAAYSENVYPLSLEELSKLYSSNNSYFSESYRNNDESIEKFQSIDDSKSSDIKLLSPDFNAQDYTLTKSVIEPSTAVNDLSDKNSTEDPVPHIKTSISVTPKEIGCAKVDSYSNIRLKDEQNILNKNRVDYPSCKQRQRMALSAVSVLTNLQKMLENPRIPVSLLLVNVAHYGDQKHSSISDSTSKSTKKKLHKIPIKETEDLIKDTNVLMTPEASRWKWESIRVLLKICCSNSKILNDANFKILFKKLVIFFKPSSKKYSHTPLKYDHNHINIYTLVACELVDVLLDEKNIDGMKLLCEFLEDVELQLKHVAEAKSVHDCLLSPQRLANSLSQDYFLLLGKLSNSNTGLMLLQKLNILQRLQHIAVNINLDCYVKLIVSCLSYVVSDVTRKIFSDVLSCAYLSSRLYATKFLHVLLRTNASVNENFRNWLIEMLVNQLYDDNRTISLIALNALNEAVDNKECLDALISQRPSLLHLGDAGLLLLIRFLSTEKGFTYLQAANFIAPQLQRWASSFNTKYTLIVEGELHDSMSQYQRGDDGRYRRRITGDKAVLRDVMVPPHLYGQLVQHWQGFNLLLKQENIHKMIQVILMANYENDDAIIELKSALWAMGHFSTSSAGAKYLTDCGVIKAIVHISEKVTVYSVKATAFYVLALIASTNEGVSALNKYKWKCLKRNRFDSHFMLDNPFSSFSLDKFYNDDSVGTVSSSLDFESPQNGEKTFSEERNDTIFKFSHKFCYEKKSATLPERGGCLNQTQHFRSFSESKADTSDDWSLSGSPPLMQNYICDLRTDSSTSGISSSDSVQGRTANANEKILTLSPIPSSNSLTTLMCHTHQKENSYAFLPKRHSSVSFSCRLSSQNTLGYKTLRMLQHRNHLSNAPSFSASATIEYLSADDRRQMSPLVRPKFPRNLRRFTTAESEIEEPPFQIDRTDSADLFTGTNHSHFSNSTEIGDDKSSISGPCYQGICLPQVLQQFLRRSIDRSRNIVSKKSSQTSKASTDTKSNAGSEIQQVKLENNEKAIKRRRHDKSACLLCSTKENLIEAQNVARNRKTSTSSIHRIRTETESSYGGGVGLEIDSPIFSTWQQKPLGLVDNTSGLVSGSTLESDETRSMSVVMSNDSPLQSRSVLRKEVLKLVEQLGNPVLYKTCKQGLLQLKQVCGDLFQDICLFSDVCVLLGSINYRIQARQLIQDLFLDAPFHELYEETGSILYKTSCLPDSAIAKAVAAAIPSTDSLSSQSNSLTLLNTGNDLTESSREDQKNNNNLDVIIETDGISEAIKNNIKAAFVYDHAANLKAKRCYHSSPPNECCDATPRLSSPERDKQLLNERTKNLFDCRRAYSYPATNHIVTGFGFYDPNVQCAYSFKVPATRSRSVSATCSYISEISVTRQQKFLKRMSNKAVNESSVTDSISIDPQFNNLASFSKRSLISLRNTSSSVLLALESPVDLLH